MNTANVKVLARRAVQVEVSLLRTPLLLTDRLASRFGVGSAVHPRVQQGLAALDAVADRVADRTDVASTTEPSTTEPSTTEPSAAESPEPATPAIAEDQVEDVAEELLEEQEYAPRAGELADDDDLRRVQAELNAKRLLAEQQRAYPDRPQ